MKLSALWMMWEGVGVLRFGVGVLRLGGGVHTSDVSKIIWLGEGGQTPYGQGHR